MPRWNQNLNRFNESLRWVALVVSMSASHAVGGWFTAQPGQVKTIIKMVQTASLHGTHALG